jgi:hypothetical protein
MNQIKQFKYVMPLLLIFGLAFYWYSFRPYRVSQICIEFAMQRYEDFPESDRSDIRYWTWRCEKQHGITR